MFDGFGHSEPLAACRTPVLGSLRLDYSTAVKGEHLQAGLQRLPPPLVSGRGVPVRGAVRRGLRLTAEEQGFWYEQLRFFVDSVPNNAARAGGSRGN